MNRNNVIQFEEMYTNRVRIWYFENVNKILNKMLVKKERNGSEVIICKT